MTPAVVAPSMFSGAPAVMRAILLTMVNDDDDGTLTRPVHDRFANSEPESAAPSETRFRLGSLIGRGGMGEVVAATDQQFGREVAVKRLVRKMTSGESWDRSMRRFIREAVIQGRLDHPAIVPVHDLGIDSAGQPYFSMKRVTGQTVAELIPDPAQTQRLLRAFVDVCIAIEFAHSRGVVHRDIKPQNIVLGNFGDVYVLDWGAAKIVGEVESGVRGVLVETEDVTVDGTVIGTPGYMAPEQEQGLAAVDGRADVFALGLVLYEILVAERLGRVRAKASTDPRGSRPSLHRAKTHRDIPPELDAICARATVHDRDLRLASPRELGEAVQRFLDGDRDLALRESLAREHLAAARGAFDQGAWRDAMRDAGRALALDPKLEGAAELVTRLMLEPPMERSPELDRAIEADNLETLRRHARSGAMGYLGFLALLPILIFGDRVQLGYAALLVGAIGLNVWLLVSEWSYRQLNGRTLRIALGNILLVLVVARLTSPYLLAPAIATLATTVMVLSPNYDRPRSVLLLVLGMAGAIVALHVIESTGLWAASTHSFPGGLAFTPPLLQLSEAGKQIVLALATLGLVGAAGGTAYMNRRAERSVRDRLHRQTWLLRQLVA